MKAMQKILCPYCRAQRDPNSYRDALLKRAASVTEIPRLYTPTALRQLIAEMATELKSLQPEKSDGWQPMETAPKDGSEVLLRVKLRAGITGKMLVGHYIQGGHCIEDHPPISAGWYFFNGCEFDRASEPTHWMPLPGLPATSNGEKHG
jgi:hypothetical protein